jgi:ABC-type sugar transport system ATPase subunit
MTSLLQTSTPLEIRGLSKRFGATQALDGVSMTVEPGSIHALIGLNGSGKSTLVKVLAGFHHADEGDISMGEVAFVHQDLGLLPSLTVLENFAIGRPMAMRWGQIDWTAERKRAVAALRDFGLEGTVRRPIGSLTQAEQAVVAIARALDRSASGAISTLVLDEPTSALPNHEIGMLADAMRAFAARGVGIVFITHRLQEVVDLADSLTVLRNGRVVFSGRTSETDVNGMVRLMVGDAPQASPTDWVSARREGAPVLAGRDLRTETLDGLSFEVHRGEIVGAFGMAGSGLESLSALLAGRATPTGGSVVYDGEPLRAHSARAREIGYVPSDRPRRGVLPGLTVRENISVRSLSRVVRRGRISGRAERELARQWGAELKIKPANPDAPILTLSGGNQQKAVLGRWLAIEPQAIVAEEPTQGVDVWAKAEILRRLRIAAEGGAGVLLTAVEPEEILDFCDRVVVLRQGRIALDAPRTSLSITDILSAMH